MAIRTGLRSLQRVLVKTVDNLNGRNTGKIVILFVNTVQDFIDAAQVTIEVFFTVNTFTGCCICSNRIVYQTCIHVVLWSIRRIPIISPRRRLKNHRLLWFTNFDFILMYGSENFVAFNCLSKSSVKYKLTNIIRLGAVTVSVHCKCCVSFQGNSVLHELHVFIYIHKAQFLTISLQCYISDVFFSCSTFLFRHGFGNVWANARLVLKCVHVHT